MSGVVAIFTIISGNLASASQRFFSFELGRNDNSELRSLFMLTKGIYLLLGICIIIFGELIVNLFIEEVFNYPESKKQIVNYIFRCSIYSLAIRVNIIPNYSILIAKERFIQYVSILTLDSIMSLLIAIMLVYSDRPIYDYSLGLVLSSVIVLILSSIITFSLFGYSSFWISFNQVQLKKLFSYTSWSIIGSLAAVMKTQGLSLILFNFFGPLISSSHALTMRVNSAYENFGDSVLTAAKPRLVKLYARKDSSQMINTLVKSMLLLIFPLLAVLMVAVFKTNFLLQIWLTEVPVNLVIFVRFTLIATFIEFTTRPLVALIQATGKIRFYSLIMALVQLIFIAIVYILFVNEADVLVAYILMLLFALVSINARLLVANRILEFNIWEVYRPLIIPVLQVILVNAIIYLILGFIVTSPLLSLVLMICAFLGTSIYLGIPKSYRIELYAKFHESIVRRR
ncbi:hypothetical protein N9R36_00950 [bacterium]|nr:hypothetical protein [bacterium]